MLIEFNQGILNLFDLLSGNVLELDAGQYVHEHAAQFRTGVLDCRQYVQFVVEQLLVAVAEIAQLRRELGQRGTLGFDIAVGQFVLELLSNRIGNGIDAGVDLVDRDIGFG